jgi:NAD(P)-dependent dehydrogenase (short-subunit alcohol dehydrogenase family)
MESARTIIVTGASSGIGAYCAHALKADGWRVFATARKPADIATLKADGLEAFYLDYRESESIAALVDSVLEATGGKLDALYNNGGQTLLGAVEDLPVDLLREQFETNFFGWHDLTRRVIPAMRQQGHGRLVHCSSAFGQMPMPWYGAYVASKYALEGLMLSLRSELEGSGIRVSLLEPGPIRTRMASNSLDLFERTIGARMESSIYRQEYEAERSRLLPEAPQSRFKPGPEAVYAKLKYALTSANPKPHYVVTSPARIALFMKRLLPRPCSTA